MTIRELELQINKFFLDSEKDSQQENAKGVGIYPNSVILTKAQYDNFLKQIFKIDVDFGDEVVIQSICGLKVIITDYIAEPRLIRMCRNNKGDC